jgi:hypothetical protein
MTLPKSRELPKIQIIVEMSNLVPGLAVDDTIVVIMGVLTAVIPFLLYFVAHVWKLISEESLSASLLNSSRASAMLGRLTTSKSSRYSNIHSS